jgi:hypothetical protein
MIGVERLLNLLELTLLVLRERHRASQELGLLIATGPYCL